MVTINDWRRLEANDKRAIYPHSVTYTIFELLFDLNRRLEDLEEKIKENDY